MPLSIALAGANGAPGLNGAAGRTGRLYCIQVIDDRECTGAERLRHEFSPCLSMGSNIQHFSVATPPSSN